MFWLSLAGRNYGRSNSNVLEITHRQARIEAFKLSWLEAGDAPVTLVLLHGIGSNADNWSAQISYFAPHYRVIAWNAPGYAQSEALPPGDVSPTIYANALKAALDFVGAERIVLVGHSLGALIAARFALLYPDKLEKLILSAPASGYNCQAGAPLPETLQKRLDDIASLGPRGMAESRAARTLTATADPNVIARAKLGMASVSVRGYQDAVQLLACGHLHQDLSKLALGFSVVCGTADQTTPLDKVSADTAVSQRQNLLKLDGAAHASYLEFPDLFNHAINMLLTNKAP